MRSRFLHEVIGNIEKIARDARLRGTAAAARAVREGEAFHERLVHLFTAPFSKPRPDKEQIRRIEGKGKATVIRLTGSITFETLDALRDEFVAKLKGRRIRHLLFDLDGVTRADMAAVAALVYLLRTITARRAKSRIGFVNISLRLKGLLEISKTEKLFTIYRTESEALEHLS